MHVPPMKQPLSTTAQVFEQPSHCVVLPSSQASLPSRTPFPQTGVAAATVNVIDHALPTEKFAKTKTGYVPAVAGNPAANAPEDIRTSVLHVTPPLKPLDVFSVRFTAVSVMPTGTVTWKLSWPSPGVATAPEMVFTPAPSG
jgi:hypothetical protein